LYCGFYGDDISTDTTYTDINWHHYAMTFDTLSYMQTLLRDGEVVMTRTADTIYLGNGKLYIGVASNRKRNFRGNLDEIRLWNRALSVEEIKENMYRYANIEDTTLIAYWSFDEPLGSFCTDKGFLSNNGILHNGDLVRENSTLWCYHSIASDSLVTFDAGYSPVSGLIDFEIINSPMNGNVEIDIDGLLQYSPADPWLGYDSLSVSKVSDIPRVSFSYK